MQLQPLAPDISFSVIRGGVNSSSDGSPSAFTQCVLVPSVPSYEPMFVLIIMQEVEMGWMGERASPSF